MRPRTLIGAGCAALLLAPALAYSQGQPSAGFLAEDTPGPPAWSPVNTVTITTDQPEVAFAARNNKQPHFVAFKPGAPKPTCDGVPMQYPQQLHWSGTCRFPSAGVYEFFCPVHEISETENMRGTVRVVAPTPTATPGESATPAPGAATPTPTPTPAATPAPVVQTAINLELAAIQRGARVRGRVDVLQAASRLEVTLTARIGARRVRVGRTAKTAAAGAVAFTVPLEAKARRALRRRGRLVVTVAVSLAPPSGTMLTRSRRVRLRG